MRNVSKRFEQQSARKDSRLVATILSVASKQAWMELIDAEPQAEPRKRKASSSEASSGVSSEASSCKRQNRYAARLMSHKECTN